MFFRGCWPVKTSAIRGISNTVFWRSQTWCDGKQTLALSYQWLFECRIVPEAFLRCLCHTCALRSSPLTDAISHTGSETTRFQSHHCCEGNCLGLSHKSTPPCALQAKTYIYPLSQHTSTHTHTLHWFFFYHFYRNKRGVLLNLSLSLFLFYFFNILVCRWLLNVRRQSPPHVL